MLLIKDGEVAKFQLQKIIREDVTSYFKLDYNVDDCGYIATIDSKKLKKGTYKIGVYLKNEETNKAGLMITDKTFVKK